MVASADQAKVIAAFDGEGLGRVRWQGQDWAALNGDPAQELAIGQRVTVMGREGTRLPVLFRQLPSCSASCPALERQDQGMSARIKAGAPGSRLERQDHQFA